MLKFLLCFHWFIEFSNEKVELFWIVRRCIQHEGCLLLGGEEECVEHFLIKKKKKDLETLWYGRNWETFSFPKI